MPIVVIMLWWSACFGLFALGWPIEYDKTNFRQVSIIFGSSAVLSVLGFLAGLSLKVKWAGPAMSWWPALGLLVSILLFFPSVSTYSALGLEDLGAAITDQGAAYQETSRLFESGITGGALVFVLTILTGMFTVTAIPYFSLRAIERKGAAVVLLVIAIVPSIAMSVLTGRDQQSGMAVLLIGGAWLIALARRRVWSLLRMIGLSFALGVSVFLVMSYRRYQRLAGVELCSPGQLNCDENSSGFLAQSARIFASYATQGFEGMGRAFNAGWEFGGGFSHSVAVDGLYKRFVTFGEVSTVTDQLDFLGWSSTATWSTALTQLANDLPWALVPVYFGAWATILGFTWKLAIAVGDWLSVTLFCLTLYGFLFVPQNFQLGITAPTYIAYMFLIALLVFIILAGRRGDQAHS